MKILNRIIGKMREWVGVQQGLADRIFKFSHNAVLRMVLVITVILAGTLITKIVIEHQQYKDYKVVSDYSQKDVVAAQYVKLGDNLLKYNGDGAVLLDDQSESIWTQSYDIESPSVDVCQEAAVVYTRKGTQMVILGTEGKLGNVEAKMPILKAKVSSEGTVAAILEDGENTWINYYSTQGEQIATAKTRIDSPGYPLDISVSPDGMLLMVTYLLIENGTPKSQVAFYNFGNTGQNQMDNMVSGYTYAQTITPQVCYLNKSLSVAFRDDGFTVYKGEEIPKESSTVSVDKEIVSTFYSEKYIGLIFNSDSSNKQYTMQVYTVQGKLKFKKDFSMDYNAVKIERDTIIMHNDAQMSVFNMQGRQKFKGTIREGILSVFKNGSNRYQLLTEKGLKTIKLR
jgi:hypothetical protein